MITIKAKVQSDDLEQESRDIEKINEEKSILDLKDPFAKKISKRGTHMNGVFSEDIE